MDTDVIDSGTNESTFTFLSEFQEPWGGQTVLEVGSLAVILVCACVGNSMVLAAVIRSTKLRTVTNLLVCNLAVTDILFVAWIPFIAVTRLTQNWVFGDVICKLVTYVQFVSGICSIVTMVSISIVRFIRVCHRNRFKLTNRDILLVIVIQWVISAAFPVPVALAQRIKQFKTANEMFVFCGMTWASNFHADIYLGFMATFFFVIPVIIISVLYLKILIVVKGTVSRTAAVCNRSEKSIRKQIRLVKMFAAIVAIFVIMWLPFFIINFLGVHFRKITSTHFTATLILALSNSCINPILYGYFNFRFRDEFKAMCCKDKKPPAHQFTTTYGANAAVEMGCIEEQSSTTE